jgi:hypothetical protein
MKLFPAVRGTWGAALGVSVLFFLAMPASRAGTDAPNFTGHYELADKNADRSFSLDVTEPGALVVLSFSAAMNDGSGAAPDGDGKGALDKSGGLAFTFKDSFDNEGTGTLVQEKGSYHLLLNATKVNDPRCLRFYGDVLLRKTSDKPQSN